MDVTLLLFQLCADFGFCLSDVQQMAVAENPPLEVDDFLLAVLRATGTDPADVPAKTLGRAQDVIEEHFRRLGISVPERPVPWIDVGHLLYELCVTLGFCLPPDDQAELMAEPPRDVDEFAAAVFAAEGLEPWRPDGKLWLAVRDMTAAYFARWGAVP